MHNIALNTSALAVEAILTESISVKQSLREREAKTIAAMALEIAEGFRKGNRLFLFGNGGSAADAQHVAAEFVNRFQMDRPPLPAIALTVDASILTSIGNDFSFNDIFIKQLQALGQTNDMALGISTSGRSPNVLKALKWAHRNGLHTYGWAGADHTDMDSDCQLIIHAPSDVTARVQECHITIGHAICALVDKALFGENQ